MWWGTVVTTTLPLVPIRFYDLNSMHTLFQLLTFNLIFHIPGHFFISRVLRGSGVLTPKKILKI
jgi:hypothetical protein